MNEKKENTVPNIWAAQENLMHFYRVLSAGLGLAGFLILLFMMALTFRDPVVITKGEAIQEFYPSERDKVNIGNAEVEAFTKQFLEALYVWDNFNEESLSKEINPFAEDGLVIKILAAQSQKYGKELKSKKLSQALTFVNVKVLDDRVICNFDRILKIEGIPLVIPTEVTFSMIKKSPTRLNPMGIYVAGITEREGGD